MINEIEVYKRALYIAELDYSVKAKLSKKFLFIRKDWILTAYKQLVEEQSTKNGKE